MANKKYLDEVGLTHLIGLLDNYPDNDILAALIDAMQDGLDEKVNIDDNFDLSDRMAKGIDSNGDVVQGAIIESRVSGQDTNVASGLYSHAEGNHTRAASEAAHSEGVTTVADGPGSHAEGYYAQSHHYGSHAEGVGSYAAGYASHAEGTSTYAKYNSQHVFGANNIVDPSSQQDVGSRGTYIEIVGNGPDANNRSNARTLDWNGNETLAGKLTIGAAPTANMDVTTKQYVDNAITNIPSATTSTSGLMSALDKQVLDNLNPNVVVTMDNMAVDSIHLINAKPENTINFEGIIEPQIGAQIRTSNLLDVDTFTPGFYIGSNGNLANNANDHVGDFIPVSPGDDIYYTGTIGPTSSSSINRRLHVYKADKTWIKQISFASRLKVGDNWSTHGTVPSNGAYVRVSWGVEDINVMISVGAPAKYEPYYITPYSPLSGITIYVSSDGTTEHMNTYHEDIPAALGNIYSAKFNPIQGKIYATSQYIASYNGETLTGRWWSDRDVYTEDGTPTIGAEVIYLLDEEDYIEYDVTAVNIPLFYRNNYISVDNGYITAFSYYAETLAANHFTIYDGVTFGETHINEQNVINWNDNVDLTNQLVETKADLQSPSFTGTPLSTNPSRGDYSGRIATTTFAQSLWNNVAPVETSNKASQNYEVGDYLMFQGYLYKVTAIIAKGTTLTVNTNITATTVMDEIKAILNS